MAYSILDWLGRDTGYVKVEKKDWRDFKKVYRNSKAKLKLIDKYEKDISSLEKTIEGLKGMVGQFRKFLKEYNLLEKFEDFIDPKKESLLDKMLRYDRQLKEGREHRMPTKINKRDEIAM